MKMSYKNSVALALSLGFKRVEDESAFKGEYFFKDGKKWIHWIKKLKAKLNITDDRELIDHGYDLDSYCKYKNYTNTMVIEEIQRILLETQNSESVLFGKQGIINNSEQLKNVAYLAQEGFDDEILVDFSHQMSKK